MITLGWNKCPTLVVGDNWGNGAGRWVIQYVTGQPVGRVGLLCKHGHRFEVSALTMLHWIAADNAKLLGEGIAVDSRRGPRHPDRQPKSNWDGSSDPKPNNWDGSSADSLGPEW